MVICEEKSRQHVRLLWQQQRHHSAHQPQDEDQHSEEMEAAHHEEMDAREERSREKHHMAVAPRAGQRQP